MNQRVRTNLLKMITALEGGASITEIGELLQDGGEMQMHTQTLRRPQDAKP